MRLVLHIITGLGDGGAEAVLFRLATAKNTRFMHAVVALGGGGKYASLLREMGIEVTCLDMPPGRVTWAGVSMLRSVIQKKRPDVVQTWMYHANLVGAVAARFSGRHQVYWGIHHTTLVAGTTGSSTKLVDWICARLSRVLPAGIIACAEKARAVHVANGYDANKFTVIPNGYDLSVFTPDMGARARVRAEWNVTAEVPVLGLVGRWDPQKDHANLITAVAQARSKWPNLRLILVGNGCDTENSALMALLNEAKLNEVHCLGRRADIPAIMNALDLHVLASYSEAFPNVVAEAMACGTPSIVTDVGDAAEIIGNTGWVVPPKNAAALAEAIYDALSQWNHRPQWSLRQSAARARIESEFSLDRMVARYQAVWEL